MMIKNIFGVDTIRFNISNFEKNLAIFSMNLIMQNATIPNMLANFSENKEINNIINPKIVRILESGTTIKFVIIETIEIVLK